MKLTVIKDYKGGKSVMAIACQFGMPHPTMARILKNKNDMMDTVKGPALLKATRRQVVKGLYHTGRNS